MKTFLAISALLAFNIFTAAAQSCQTCQTSNDVYCINETSYYDCMRGAPVGSIQSCEAGNVCSNAADVCVPGESIDSAAGILNVCGNPSGGDCGSCAGGAKYTCVSSTQYARCSSAGNVGVVSACPDDEICVLSAFADYETVCVPSCAASFLSLETTCSNAVYVPPTPVTPPTTQAPATTTPTAVETRDACVAAAVDVTALYFYTTYAGTDCRSYVYCERSSLTSSDWFTVFLSCPAAKPYFSSSRNSCVAARPDECAIPTTTTAPTTTIAPP